MRSRRSGGAGGGGAGGVEERRSRSDWLEEPGQEATYQKLVATIPVKPRVALYSILAAIPGAPAPWGAPWGAPEVSRARALAAVLLASDTYRTVLGPASPGQVSVPGTGPGDTCTWLRHLQRLSSSVSTIND